MRTIIYIVLHNFCADYIVCTILCNAMNLLSLPYTECRFVCRMCRYSVRVCSNVYTGSVCDHLFTADSEECLEST